MVDWDAWPKCAVPACTNKSCLRLASKYCWPHTPGTPSEARENLDATESDIPILESEYSKPDARSR